MKNVYNKLFILLLKLLNRFAKAHPLTAKIKIIFYVRLKIAFEKTVG